MAVAVARVGLERKAREVDKVILEIDIGPAQDTTTCVSDRAKCGKSKTQ